MSHRETNIDSIRIIYNESKQNYNDIEVHGNKYNVQNYLQIKNVIVLINKYSPPLVLVHPEHKESYDLNLNIPFPGKTQEFVREHT